MKKNLFLATVIPATTLAPVFCTAAKKHMQADRRMNIVYIMSDDHAFQAISAYGNPLSRQAPTPNIDRLAAQGTLFNRAYVENSLSTPSRACLMTGMYSHQNGQTMLSNKINDSLTFVSEILHDSGYQTGLVGKWHMLCEPRGFDSYYALRDQGEYYNPGFKTPNTNGKYVKEEGYATELITKHAIEFLDNRDTRKPFALYVHHKAPHRNWMPAPQYYDLYEDIDFPMPANFYDNYHTRGRAMQEQSMSIAKDMRLVYDLKAYGLPVEQNITDTKWSAADLANFTPEQKELWLNNYAKKNQWFLDNYNSLSEDEIVRWKYQRYVKDYLRVIRSVDDSVGEILDYLESHNLMDNTIVVYCSDQGFYMGEHGWFDKRFMFEESFRTPLIVHYPGNKGGSRSDVLVQNIDFAPTFLDAAGVQKPDYMSGLSLLPVLRADGAQPEQWRDYLYYHFYDHTPQHNVMRHDGVFDKRYKYIHFYDETGRLTSYDEFYDLDADPDEMYNAIKDKRYAEHVKRLREQLNNMRTTLGVKEY